jgi:predicted site-specific integrase-resolvase
MLEKHYQPNEAAELLSCDSEQVLAWIHSGELVASNIAKTLNAKRPRWRIPESEIGRFLIRRHPASQQQQQPTQRPTKRPPVKQYV